MELLEQNCNHNDITRYIVQVLEVARSSNRRAPTQSPPGKAAPGLAPKRVSRLIDEYAAGASTYELAARYVIRRDMVTTYVRRAGLVVRPGPQSALDDEMQRQVAGMYADGASIRTVATRFCVSDNTVLKALKAQGVPSRPRRGGVERKV